MMIHRNEAWLAAVKRRVAKEAAELSMYSSLKSSNALIFNENVEQPIAMSWLKRKILKVSDERWAFAKQFWDLNLSPRQLEKGIEELKNEIVNMTTIDSIDECCWWIFVYKEALLRTGSPVLL